MDDAIGVARGRSDRVDVAERADQRNAASAGEGTTILSRADQTDHGVPVGQQVARDDRTDPAECGPA